MAPRTRPTAAAAAILDLEAIAAKAQEIDALPTAATGTPGSSPFDGLIESSATNGKAIALPPVPEIEATRITNMLRRAGKRLGAHVATRRTTDKDGSIVVSFAATRTVDGARRGNR